MTSSPFRVPSAAVRGPVQQRRWWSAWGIVASILLCAAVGVLIAGFLDRAGQKNSVLVLARRVPQSAQITREDLTTVSLSGDVSAIPAKSVNQVVGRRAAYTVEAGAVLQVQALAAPGAGDPGFSRVGISVAAGQSPDRLKAGDVVRVLQVPDANASSTSGDFDAAESATVLADGAVIVSVTEDPSSSGGVVATVRVPTDAAGPLVVASSRGRVGLMEVGGQ